MWSVDNPTHQSLHQNVSTTQSTPHHSSNCPVSYIVCYFQDEYSRIEQRNSVGVDHVTCDVICVGQLGDGYTMTAEMTAPCQHQCNLSIRTIRHIYTQSYQYMTQKRMYFASPNVWVTSEVSCSTSLYTVRYYPGQCSVFYRKNINCKYGNIVELNDNVKLNAKFSILYFISKLSFL